MALGGGKRSGSRKQDLIKMLAIRQSAKGLPFEEIKVKMAGWKKLTTAQLEIEWLESSKD